MNPHILRALHEYNAASNQRLLAATEHLSHDELTRPISPSHESVWAVLRHMFVVEAAYFAYCQGRSFTPTMQMTIADLRRSWQNVADEARSFLTSLSDDEPHVIKPVQLGEHVLHFTVWQMVIQVYMHSTHHRGELSSVLTLLGYPVGHEDIIAQFAEQSGQRWPWK